MDKIQRKKNSGACCKDESKIVRCTMTALEKMKDMFEVAVGNLEDPSCGLSMTPASGCMMDNRCQIDGCPFRTTGISPNALQTFCTRDKLGPANGRADRNAMRLMPGEVGLRGNRATFHLGQGAGRPVPTATDGRPTGAVYYNMSPAAAAAAAVAGKGGARQQMIAQQQQQPRKHVMQVLPSLPTADPSVGPVTGLPISSDEHVFVLRLGKRFDEPDEKARLQIEVRLPKQQEPQRVEADTQFLQTDLPVAAVAKKGKKGKKGKKSKKGSSANKGKKSGSSGGAKKKAK